MPHEDIGGLLMYLRLVVQKHQPCEPVIRDDDICMGDIKALIDEIDRLRALVDSERQRLGDECDRLVIEWYEKVQEVEQKLSRYEPPPKCSGCGYPLEIEWVCGGFDDPECLGHDGPSCV